MAHTLSRQYSRDLYYPWLQGLIDFGEKVDVRGRTTQEWLNCVSEVYEPWHHCILVPSRRWNPWLALSEALWILSGRNDVAALRPYNQHITDYSDDGETLYGAYGKRIFHQIDEVIHRLQKDPSDRRAVISIWGQSGKDALSIPFDLMTESKDPPCNDMIMFKLREEKLHMTVINRSNDVHYGLFAVNLPTFGILQSYMAARLNVGMGYQTHFSNSLHVYTDDPRAVQITDNMLYHDTEDLPAYPYHSLAFIPNTRLGALPHKEFAAECSSVLDGQNYRGNPHFLRFAFDFLSLYKNRDKEGIKTLEKIWPEYADWWLAAKIFADKVWK